MIRKALTFAAFALLSTSALAATPIQEIKTATGYTVWLAEDHTLPIVTAKIAFEQSGAAYDPAGKEGTASFLTQMLDEGAGEMNSLAFHQALENKAIKYGAEASEDMITVSVQTLSDHKAEALRLMLLTLTKPRFDTEAAERIRASIVSDIVMMQEEPEYLASRKWKELAFPGHVYSHPRRGTADTVKKISQDDLRNFAKAHFFAGPAPIISVTGDITADEVRALPIPVLTNATAPAPLADITVPDGKEPVVVAHDVPQTVVIASMPALPRTDPQYYTLQVLNQIIGGNSITSRLGSEVRNKRGLAYHVGTGIEVMDHANFISANFATRNAQAGEALSVFNQVLADVRDKGVSQQEVQDAKNYLTGSFPLDHDTQNELAGFLIGIQHYHLGMDYPEKRNALVEKVTLQDVNILAKKLLIHPPLVVMSGTPQLTFQPAPVTPPAATP